MFMAYKGQFCLYLLILLSAKLRKNNQELTTPTTTVQYTVELCITAQSEVMLWIHNTLTKMTDCYKFRNDRII
jgi:hypothetical protein